MKTKQLKILMISGRADFGGGPEHVYQLTKAIGDRAELFVACPNEEPYWSRLETLVGTKAMLEIPHRSFSLSSLLQLANILRSNQINLVHAHGRAAGLFGRLAAWLAGVPCFYTPHGGTPVESFKTFVYAMAEFFLSLGTRRIIAVSATEGGTLKNLCSRSSQLVVVPNGVVVPSAPPERCRNESDSLRIIHATRFVYQKNSELLIQILQTLRDCMEINRFHVEILGDGPGRVPFEAQLRKLHLEKFVTFHGAVCNPGDYLASADCLVSTSRWEGLPLIVLEAMAAGLPVIATDVVGNRDAVLHGSTGFLFDLSMPGEAAKRLMQIARDAELHSLLAKNAWVRANCEFSVETMAAATLALYATLTPKTVVSNRWGRHTVKQNPQQ